MELTLGRVTRFIRKEISLRQGKILTAVFNMTYRCNLECQTCGVWVRGKTDTETELTTEEVLRAAAELKELGVGYTVLVGSEPLMRRDALDIVEGLIELGLGVAIITNGTIVNEPIAKRIVKAGVDSVTISIDAVGERHNEIRNQPLVYERAVAGLKRLQTAKEEAGALKPDLAVHATISVFNTDVLEDISDLTESLGVPVDFQLASETSPDTVQETTLDGTVIVGTELIARDKSFLPDQAGVQRIREFLSKPGVLVKHPALRVLTMMTDDDILNSRFPIKRCSVIRGEIQIDPYGNVTPCSHLSGYTYGSVLQSSIRDLWNGEKRARLVQELKKGLLPVCPNCCQHSSNWTPLQKVSMRLTRS